MLARSLGLAFVALVACSSSSRDATAPTTSSTFTFSTPDFTLQPGEEKYLCYAETLEEDLAIDRFDYKARPGIHHSIFSKTLAPEPNGFSECKVLLRTTWVPSFLSATGDASIELPAGSGVILAKGTQVVVQLHLLNAGTAPMTNHYSMTMRKSTVKNPDPIGIYAFGTLSLQVPPKATSQQSDRCTNPQDLDVFAVLPHMHTTGKALKFEAGQTDDTLKEIYRIDDFNFDRQVVMPHPFQLKAGMRTRVTCTFDNTSDKTLKFGESSLDEMCFMITFAKHREGVDGCDGNPVTGTTMNPDCGKKPENELGIGRTCTKGGGECGSTLKCTLDQSSTPPGAAGFCFKLGCTSTAACGSGATCCAPKEAGGLVKVCMPDDCRPGDCTPA
jgi:hypothetical protein